MANKDKIALEAALKEKKEAVSQKLQLVKEEVQHVQESVQNTVKKVSDHKGIAITVGAVAVGAVVGYYFWRKSSHSEGRDAHVQLLSDPESAQKALDSGAPVYLYKPQTSASDKMLAPVKQMFSQLSGQLLQMGTQIVMDLVQERLRTLSQALDTTNEVAANEESPTNKK